MKEPVITIYDKPTSISDDEKQKIWRNITGIYVGEKQILHELEDYYSKPYDSDHDHAIDAMSYAIHHMVSDARKGYKYKWHPALLYRRIKSCIRNIFKLTT